MQPLILTMNFWDPKHFDFTDALNQEIWEHLPKVQQQIQPIEVLTKSGSVGAQQAMLGTDLLAQRGCPLPWVPDLVGKESQNKNGVMVVGLAYAGFIREYSGRPASMLLSDYSGASSVEDFQRLFIRDVVDKDSAYYNPIQNLCSIVGSSARLALLDLCRASFVKRGAGTSKRGDCSKSINIKQNFLKYENYVENKAAMGWLWRRFANSTAKQVIALGLNAEHGLLQMFDKQKMKITQGGHRFIPKKFAQGGWAVPYADPDKNLRYWLNNSTWWTVQGTINGVERIWYVLPVYHPAVYNRYDPDYTQSKLVLKEMQDFIEKVA